MPKLWYLVSKSCSQVPPPMPVVNIIFSLPVYGIHHTTSYYAQPLQRGPDSGLVVNVVWRWLMCLASGLYLSVCLCQCTFMSSCSRYLAWTCVWLLCSIHWLGGGRVWLFFFLVFTKDGMALGGSPLYTRYNYLSRYVCGTSSSTRMCFLATPSPAIDCMYLCVFKLMSQVDIMNRGTSTVHLCLK